MLTSVGSDDFKVLHGFDDGEKFVIFTTVNIVREVGEVGVFTSDEIVDVSCGDISGLLSLFLLFGLFAGLLFFDNLGLLESQPGEGGEDLTSLTDDFDVSAFVFSSALSSSPLFGELVVSSFDHNVKSYLFINIL